VELWAIEAVGHLNAKLPDVDHEVPRRHDRLGLNDLNELWFGGRQPAPKGVDRDANVFGERRLALAGLLPTVDQLMPLGCASTGACCSHGDFLINDRVSHTGNSRWVGRTLTFVVCWLTGWC